jgi:hypothetical protein
VHDGYVKLSEWARQQSVSYQTAWRWVRDGKMPVPVRQAPSGTWIVEGPAATTGRVIAYCRVSSGDQKNRLDRQAVRVVEGANAIGLELCQAHTGTCGEIIPGLLSDLYVAALGWAGIDPFGHSTWVVHWGGCPG